MEGIVVINHEHDGVEEDAEENGVFKPTPRNQPYQTFSEFILFL